MASLVTVRDLATGKYYKYVDTLAKASPTRYVIINSEETPGETQDIDKVDVSDMVVDDVEDTKPAKSRKKE